MPWNDKQTNIVRYPDHPDLEQAYMNFRDQYVWYDQQTRQRRKMGFDVGPVTDAWNRYLKLRNRYYGYR